MIWTTLFVFAATYSLNLFFISVLYHRGLTHAAYPMSRFAKFLTFQVGYWITGMDPIAWSYMHREHHAHSDTPRDPHSPKYFGIFGVLKAQYVYYDNRIEKLRAEKTPGLHWISRSRLWPVPYLLQLLIAITLGYWTQSAWVSTAYFLGMMSHPIQGWMVNAFGHSSGSRRYNTNDSSTNNWWVALLVFGEGLQNNHHQHPNSVKFSEAAWEPDFGYWVYLIMRPLIRA